MQTKTWTRTGGVVLAFAVLGTPIGTRAHGAARPPATLRALYGLERPTSLAAAKTALILVDFQDEFVGGGLKLSGARAAIQHASELASWARRSGVLVVLIRNVAARPDSPLFAPGSPTTEFVPELRPQVGELVVQKALAGAFSRTTLDAELRGRGIDSAVIAGLMTHLAVAITATDAAVLGYRTVVVGDATATRALPGAGGEAAVDAASLKRAALDTMADRVADVMLSAEVVALPITH